MLYKNKDGTFCQDTHLVGGACIKVLSLEVHDSETEQERKRGGGREKTTERERGRERE